MLKAIDSENYVYLSYIDNISRIRNYYCPVCKKRVFFVNCKEKVKHFKHKKRSTCILEPEGSEHLNMKKHFIDSLFLKNEQIEVNLKFAVPDLFIKSKDGHNIAIECQYSAISKKKFIERTYNYTKNNIYVLWVFHIDMLKKRKMIRTLKNIANNLYEGRIYIFDNNDYSNPIKRYKFKGKNLEKISESKFLCKEIETDCMKIGEPKKIEVELDYPTYYVQYFEYPKIKIKIARYYDKY